MVLPAFALFGIIIPSENKIDNQEKINNIQVGFNTEQTPSARGVGVWKNA
jgi:hypothetical protein